MWLLFVPLVILMVVLMAVGALSAGVFAVVGWGWPWLLIGLGMWLFWHEDGHHRRARHHHRRGRVPVHEASSERRSPPSGQMPEKDPAAARPHPLRQSELPIDVQVKVEQIRRKVDVLLSYADRFPPFSQDLYLVRQTASEYLPHTVSAYLAMSKETAQRPMKNGQTPHQELKAQLDLLDSKLDDIAQDLQRQDTDRLLANRRFLEDRFGLRNARPPFADVAQPAAEVA
jgi:hypothetical protein